MTKKPVKKARAKRLSVVATRDGYAYMVPVDERQRGLLCEGFVLARLSRLPRKIKLTLSNKPGRGLAEAVAISKWCSAAPEYGSWWDVRVDGVTRPLYDILVELIERVIGRAPERPDVTRRIFFKIEAVKPTTKGTK